MQKVPSRFQADHYICHISIVSTSAFRQVLEVLSDRLQAVRSTPTPAVLLNRLRLSLVSQVLATTEAKEECKSGILYKSV
jgi:hypothetical protein